MKFENLKISFFIIQKLYFDALDKRFYFKVLDLLTLCNVILTFSDNSAAISYNFPVLYWQEEKP